MQTLINIFQPTFLYLFAKHKQVALFIIGTKTKKQATNRNRNIKKKKVMPIKFDIQAPKSALTLHTSHSIQHTNAHTLHAMFKLPTIIQTFFTFYWHPEMGKMCMPPKNVIQKTHTYQQKKHTNSEHKTWIQNPSCYPRYISVFTLILYILYSVIPNGIMYVDIYLYISFEWTKRQTMFELCHYYQNISTNSMT